MTHPPQAQEVLAQPASAAIFLVLTVREYGEAQVKDLLSDLAGITRAVGFRVPQGDLSCVAGIGAELWDRLYDSARPAGLHPFRELSGNTHRAPATAGDLLFHIRAQRLDLCFEMASQVMNRLAGHADIADEVHGFRFFDERDLLGFVDGTESPPWRTEGAKQAVFVGSEDPAYCGSSYVIVQKYLHDLDAWNALPVEEQERAIGRRKLTDVEFPDADKATNSHLTLNTITAPDGSELKIVRDNMPFGSLGAKEFGTYYIGYAKSPDVTEQMLRNMFIGVPPGNHDRILDFSRAVTGGLFFVPTADFLADPAPTLAAAAGQAERRQATTDDSVKDGSLGIGSLGSSGAS